MTAMTMTAPAAGPRLERRRDAVVAGVAGSLAQHLGWRVGPTRALFVVSAPLFGVGPLMYLWLWAFAPLEAGERDVTRRLPVAAILLVVSGVCGVLATPFVLDGIANRYTGGVVVPLVTIGAFAAMLGGLWSALVDRRDPLRGERQDKIARSIATVMLACAALAALMLAAPQAFILALTVLVGIALVWLASWIQRFRELQRARIDGVREEQRAAMAAHLHDSVLQTLALIQNRAGASSEAGRLARAQERELRAWLYDGDTPADSDLATDLRDYGSALELDYSAAVSVVVAGEVAERASGEVAAAAREAMLNAARHAGDDVSVYIEGAGGAVDVYVRDRGDGFDLDAVPPDRLGVRESIIGRMRRAGGSATVARGASGGTEVHIRYPDPEARRG